MLVVLSVAYFIFEPWESYQTFRSLYVSYFAGSIFLNSGKVVRPLYMLVVLPVSYFGIVGQLSGSITMYVSCIAGIIYLNRGKVIRPLYVSCNAGSIFWNRGKLSDRIMLVVLMSAYFGTV